MAPKARGKKGKKPSWVILKKKLNTKIWRKLRKGESPKGKCATYWDESQPGVQKWRFFCKKK